MTRIPRHVAIIMDGNGRWAKRQGLERFYGHQKGAEIVHEIIEAAAKLGVQYLTLYTFSTENWNRPKEEVTALINLLFTQMDLDEFQKNGIRFKIIGDYQGIPDQVKEKIRYCEEATKDNTTITLVLAFGYSAKWELVEATKQIAIEVKNNQIKPEDICSNTISEHLSTRFMPDPDLLIRTGGEVRLSNFLLWQCAYAELCFTEVLWPDFHAEELKKCILDYQKRERRYGMTSKQIEELNSNTKN